MYGTRVCTHTCMYVLNSRILNQRSKEIFIFIYITITITITIITYIHVYMPLPWYPGISRHVNRTGTQGSR
jgi:hypothetical protein